MAPNINSDVQNLFCLTKCMHESNGLCTCSMIVVCYFTFTFQIIEKESAEVEAKSKTVKVDEELATEKATEAQALKNECESDLAEAIPALEAALAALDTLKAS